MLSWDPHHHRSKQLEQIAAGTVSVTVFFFGLLHPSCPTNFLHRLQPMNTLYDWDRRQRMLRQKGKSKLFYATAGTANVSLHHE